jgi:hypothetical protein
VLQRGQRQVPVQMQGLLQELGQLRPVQGRPREQQLAQGQERQPEKGRQQNRRQLIA